MAEKNELIAYAIDFVSYLISKITDIDNVILYGSITRGDFDEQSDVDLFIDTLKKDNEKKANEVLKQYYKTNKFKEWELKGIANEISLITSNINADEWKNLKRAIINTGIVLYGRYKANAEKVNQYLLFSFDNIKPDKKRIVIFRKLFGFKIDKKEYLGMAKEIGAVKIGKGALLVPLEHASKLTDYFKEKKISPRVFDLWSDVKV